MEDASLACACCHKLMMNARSEVVAVLHANSECRSRVSRDCGHSDPTTCELVEELFVQRLVLVFGAHAEEDVSADELVHSLAVGTEA